MEDPRKKRIADAIDKMVAQGASDDEIDTVVKSMQSEGDFSDVTSGASTQGVGKKGIFAPLAQGATLGAADEILGGIEGINTKLHGGSFKEGYRRGVDKVRGVGKEFSEDHPVASPVAELAGGLLLPLPAASKAIGKASTGVKIARGAATGSLIGAGAGALSSEEGSRGSGALGGSIFGGGLGAAIPASGAILGQVLNQMGARTAKGIERQAIAKIGQAAERDQISPAQLREAGQGFIGKPAIVSDLMGENGLGLTRAVAGVPGKGKQALAETLHSRQEGQLGRIMGDIENRLGMKGRDVHDVAEELIQAQKAHAEPLYAAARPLPIQSPETQQEIMSLIELPEFAAAMKRGARIAAVERNPMQGEVPLTVGDIDYMKRGLDALIESRSMGMHGAEAASISKTEARALRIRLNELLDMVDAEHPEYAEARKTFAGDARLRDALEEGKNFLNEDHQLTAKQLSRMTDGEKEMYRVGAIGALRRIGERTPENMDKVKRIFGSPEAKSRLEALFGDADSFAGLSDDMAKESKLVQTKNGALVGSRTAPMAMEMGDLFQTAANAATGNIGGLAKQGLKALISNRAKIGSEKIANAVSEKLQLRPGTPEFDALMEALANSDIQRKGSSGLPVDRLLNRALPRLLPSRNP